MKRFISRFFQKPYPKRVKKAPQSFPFQGEHYNLKELYDQINQKYFEGKLDLKIMWVGNRDLKPKYRVMFGSYTYKHELIKIHRRLDQAHIPHYFISFVIYHEMLHHVLPPLKDRRREKRRIHHFEFTQKEKEFEDFHLVKTFRKENKALWFKT